MLKKVTTDIKAAVVLIVTENLTALRMFVKNVTNSVFKFVSKQASKSDAPGQKEAVIQKGAKNVKENHYIEHYNSSCADRS